MNDKRTNDLEINVFLNIPLKNKLQSITLTRSRDNISIYDPVTLTKPKLLF